MKATNIATAYAIINILIAAFLFYLWETPSYEVSYYEAVAGTNTLRFLLFVSGIVAAILAWKEASKK